MKTAFILGKILGLHKEQVRDKFNVMENQLIGIGYKVIKPIAIFDDSKTWDDCVRSDIKKMLECNEVHLLSDWQESRGAQLMRDIAIRLGIDVVYH